MPLTILAALAASAFDMGDPALGIQNAKIVDAALFKNGYCVVTSQAEIPATGELLLEAPRSAVLGTFWLRAADGKVLSAVNGFVPKQTERDPHDIDEYLSKCVGKSITLLGQKEMTGVLENITGNTLAIRTGQGLELVNKGYYQSVRISGDQKSFKFTDTTQVPVLKISGLRGTKVQISMMQTGLWWSPAYNLDISDPDKMKLTARAIIVNDLADLKDQSIRLVTGFPNLPFLNQIDPLNLNVPVSAVVRAAPQLAGGFGGGQMQMQFANRASREDSSFSGIDMDSVQGFAAEDLFMYPQNGVTLKNGERMYRQLFQATSGYEHIHTMDAPSLTDGMGNRPNNGQPADRTAGLLDVWHEIKFTNKAGLPLTTGPATVVKGDDLIGQDTLTYTSKEQDARVKISKAVDVSSRQTEEEKSRDRAFIKDQYNNPRYDRLTVTGKIEIRNRKSTAITLEVNKVLYGEVIKSEEGTAVKEPGSMWEVNPLSTVKWRIKMEPGEAKTLEYTYTVLRSPM